MAMIAASPINKSSVVQISEEESFGIFDSASQYFLKIPGAKFLEEWRSGALSNSDEPGVFEVASLIPPSLR